MGAPRAPAGSRSPATAEPPSAFSGCFRFGHEPWRPRNEKTMQLLAILLAAIAAAAPPGPLQRFTARDMHPRPGAAPRGTAVNSADLLTARVFYNASVGFALANVSSAQYPSRSVDGGKTWRIDGPQVHIDAADAPEGVGYV